MLTYHDTIQFSKEHEFSHVYSYFLLQQENQQSKLGLPYSQLADLQLAIQLLYHYHSYITKYLWSIPKYVESCEFCLCMRIQVTHLCMHASYSYPFNSIQLYLTNIMRFVHNQVGNYSHIASQLPLKNQSTIVEVAILVSIIKQLCMITIRNLNAQLKYLHKSSQLLQYIYSKRMLLVSIQLYTI